MTNLFGREPILTLGVINAGVTLAVAFGLGLTGEQVALVAVFTTAVVSWLARGKVEPVA